MIYFLLCLFSKPCTLAKTSLQLFYSTHPPSCSKIFHIFPLSHTEISLSSLYGGEEPTHKRNEGHKAYINLCINNTLKHVRLQLSHCEVQRKELTLKHPIKGKQLKIHPKVFLVIASTLVLICICPIIYPNYKNSLFLFTFINVNIVHIVLCL